MRSFTTTMVFLTWSIVCYCQDAQYSLAHMSPIYLNPGRTGVMKENVRVNFAHRDQWRAVIPKASYRSSVVSTDVKICFDPDRSHGHAYGFGLIIAQDHAGDGDLNFTTLSFSGSFIFDLGNSALSLGSSIGAMQIRLKPQNLRFPTQFDGYNFDETISPPAGILSNTSYLFNLGVGLVWALAVDNGASSPWQEASIGLSFQHVNRPIFSLIENKSSDETANVEMRTALEGAISFRLPGSYNQLSPIELTSQFNATRQANFFQTTFLAGARLNIDVTGEDTKIGIKSGIRAGNALDGKGLNLDAVLIAAELRIPSLAFTQNLTIAASYDINVSHLGKGRRSNGAFELHMEFQWAVGAFGDCVKCW